ncbi:hypothetical protein BDW68DRAFT_116269 [Aspergillus falconensis]
MAILDVSASARGDHSVSMGTSENLVSPYHRYEGIFRSSRGGAFQCLSRASFIMHPYELSERSSCPLSCFVISKFQGTGQRLRCRLGPPLRYLLLSSTQASKTVDALIGFRVSCSPEQREMPIRKSSWNMVTKCWECSCYFGLCKQKYIVLAAND